MRAIADTGFLVAFANRADEHHEWAVELADRIAALDEAHLGGDGERPAEERAAYRRERTELKAALDAALARGRRRT